MAYKEYKVVLVAEGGCGTIVLGASGLPVKQLEMMLNKEAAAISAADRQKIFEGNARRVYPRWRPV